MPKVEAWQCPHSKKLFAIDDKQNYTKHVRAEYRLKKAAEKEAREHREFEHWFETARAQVTNLDEMAQFIKDGFSRMFYKCGRTWSDDKLPKNFKFIDISFGNMGYSESVSNSHNAPFSGTTNWGGRKKGEPRGYPGWTGQIAITVTTDTPSFSLSDTITNLGVCIGSGGSRGGGSLYQKFGYGVIIWLDDWKGIRAKIDNDAAVFKEELIIHRLKGTRPTEFIPTLE